MGPLAQFSLVKNHETYHKTLKPSYALVPPLIGSSSGHLLESATRWEFLPPRSQPNLFLNFSDFIPLYRYGKPQRESLSRSRSSVGAAFPHCILFSLSTLPPRIVLGCSTRKYIHYYEPHVVLSVSKMVDQKEIILSWKVQATREVLSLISYHMLQCPLKLFLPLLPHVHMS